MSAPITSPKNSKTPPLSLKSIHHLVADARGRLRDAGISGAESDLDARLLAQFVLDWTHERFLTSANEPEPDGFADKYDRLVSRRASREPLAYIVGRREFWGLRFDVAPGVLIPRPETELIVEVALELTPADRQVALADVCTGSGCIAVALARELPMAQVLASDISEAAVEIARRNAARHGVADRVTVAHADLLDGVDGPFDLVVANPPYIREHERTLLQREVREHEPHVALFGGLQGLDLIERLVGQAAARLESGGHLLFEFGFGQDVEVEDFIAGARHLRLIELRRDLQGIARMAVARRS